MLTHFVELLCRPTGLPTKLFTLWQANRLTKQTVYSLEGQQAYQTNCLLFGRLTGLPKKLFTLRPTGLPNNLFTLGQADRLTKQTVYSLAGQQAYQNKKTVLTQYSFHLGIQYYHFLQIQSQPMLVNFFEWNPYFGELANEKCVYFLSSF